MGSPLAMPALGRIWHFSLSERLSTNPSWFHSTLASTSKWPGTSNSETFLSSAMGTGFFVYGTLLWKSVDLSFPCSSNCLLHSKNLPIPFILSPSLFSLSLWVYIIIFPFLALYWNFSREWQYMRMFHLLHLMNRRFPSLHLTYIPITTAAAAATSSKIGITMGLWF